MPRHIDHASESEAVQTRESLSPENRLETTRLASGTDETHVSGRWRSPAVAKDFGQEGIISGLCDGGSDLCH